MNRQRADARTKRRHRRDRDRRCRRFRLDAAMRASAGKAMVADDMGFDRRDLDLVVFADQFPLGIRREGAAALFANARQVVAELVRIFGQPPIVGLMPELRPARSRVLALFLLVSRGRLGRRARILIGPLEPQHQLDQLLFGQVLQITAVRRAMDSEIAARGNWGGGNCQRIAPASIFQTRKAISKTLRFDTLELFDTAPQEYNSPSRTSQIRMRFPSSCDIEPLTKPAQGGNTLRKSTTGGALDDELASFT